MMAQNIYDDANFFAGYATLPRSVHGLDGAPEWAKMQKMLPNMAGMQVIDLGCGYGWFCRWAREQQADKVIGIDISGKMLARAAEMTQDRAVEYLNADLETLTLPTGSADLIYSSLALHYLADIEKLFLNLYQVIKPGGMLVFSAEHPIYTAPISQSWCVDDKGNKSWPVNQYQNEGERISHWFADGVIKQHRKLSTWVNALIHSGFDIIEMDEWGPSRRQIAENPSLDEEKERPMIFLMSARKPI